MNIKLSSLLDRFHGIQTEMDVLSEQITELQRKSDIDKYDELADEYYKVHDRIVKIHQSQD